MKVCGAVCQSGTFS